MKINTLTKKEKKNLIRIMIALSLFIVIFVCDKIFVLANVFESSFGWLLPFLLYLSIYLIIGYDIIFKAVRNIFHGQIFDENFLMCIATLGAFALAITKGVLGETIEGFDEACAVLLFYQVGEFFQSYATNKSRKSISALMDIRPDYANLKIKNTIKKVAPSEVNIGDVIVVNPGEKIPLDGIIISGNSTLDTKALTGESMPREVGINSEVLSGCINLTSQIEIKTTKKFYDSTVSKILELVENASSQKSKAENFITKFAKYYTPIVVAIALVLAIVPSLITSNWMTWIYRSLSFLVVSCPCALVISIPLSFFAGLGTASKYGILIKGSNYLEKLSKANIFVFDKTGTLTKGNFEINSIYPKENYEKVLNLASIAESGSSHPIAKCILQKYDKAVQNNRYSLTNIAGQGVIAQKDNEKILCGNEKLMQNNGIKYTKCANAGTVVYVAQNEEFVGYIQISDQIKEETKEVLNSLKSENIKTIMLTGDNEDVAKDVAQKIQIDEYKSSLLPQNKVEEIENIMSSKKSSDVVCFVGDGINDAPSLMRSDIGIAMGGAGSDAAIEASDIVLMKDNLKGIMFAKKLANKTLRIVKQNIAFSIAVKIAILILSALGITNMWFAVFGDVGVAVIAILNAMRVNKINNKQPSTPNIA